MLIFTDYHVGKTRDLFYTTTTEQYMDWFLGILDANPDVDCIGFLGDWHESRANIHIDTLNLSYRLIERLNSRGLPIFFVVGNHDLFNRTNRNIHSCVFFDRFENVNLVTQPTVFHQFDGKALLSPYLFHTEYDFCLMRQPVQHLLGHFEFKDFVITGSSVKMEHGPDAGQLSEYKNVLSGHFHKRQRQGNVSYVGNTFATSFADANDIERGAAIYQFSTGRLKYHNWMGGPRYVRTTLTELSNGVGTLELNDRTFVRCIADTAITFEEQKELRDALSKDYGVRSAEVIEDKKTSRQMLTEALTDLDVAELNKLTVDELVEKMLSDVNVKEIDGKRLVEIYKSLKIQ